MNIGRNNRGGFSIYSGSHKKGYEALKPGEVAPRPVSDFKTLEENIAGIVLSLRVVYHGRGVADCWFELDRQTRRVFLGLSSRATRFLCWRDY